MDAVPHRWTYPLQNAFVGVPGVSGESCHLPLRVKAADTPRQCLERPPLALDPPSSLRARPWPRGCWHRVPHKDWPRRSQIQAPWALWLRYSNRATGGSSDLTRRLPSPALTRPLRRRPPLREAFSRPTGEVHHEPSLRGANTPRWSRSSVQDQIRAAYEPGV
jgi:hypothetical protein